MRNAYPCGILMMDILLLHDRSSKRASKNPTSGMGLTSITAIAPSELLYSEASCNALVGNPLSRRTPNELSKYLSKALQHPVVEEKSL